MSADQDPSIILTYAELCLACNIQDSDEEPDTVLALLRRATAGKYPAGLYVGELGCSDDDMVGTLE